MDSANSGSIQSSSGGDEEYDSRADSISALFYPTSSSSSAAAAAAAAASLPPPPPSSSSSSSHHPNPSSFFDSFSFLDSSPLLPLDSSSSPWPPRPLRPSPVPTPDFPHLNSSLPRGPPIVQSSVQQPPENSTAIAAPPRSSKKRSRASRRAPTTVLTTDTSNFRAMVQEFTGIPSPPFGAAASPFSRSRFDLFHSSSSPSSLAPPYLLRPFPQKPPALASPNPSSSATTITAIIDALASTTNTISNAKASATIPITSAPASMANSTPTNNNYQLPSPDPGLASQNQSLFNLQSQGPVINFQSLLTQKYTLPTASPAFATRPQAVIPSPEFGSRELGLPPGLIRSEGVQSGWAGASGPDGGEQARLRPVVGGNDNGAQQRVSSCKFNYSGPGSSELNGEKGSEGVAARGEGMVDSWICSSD
ncbi:endochitinase A-like [Phoenix dactylifera]|uniref:Endochitinase A-like n=1 Tax=Phoenix dactylifera TaxID=42345 RepID=A0A8B8ZVX2_PHODC|nr:endochitinase A-like [Phoenix dactylifera]